MSSRCLGVCSWSLKPKSPLELVSACQTCGIENIQLALLPLVHDSQWSECEHILGESGIHVLSGMLEADGEDYTTLKSIEQTGGVRQDAMWSSTLENANRVADIAASLGLPMVTFHAGFIPELECIERTTMLERIRTLTDVFDNRGVLLGLETGQEKAENVVSVLEELSMPTLGVNFDPANMILYGKGDPIKAIQLLKPWVMQVHIKDAIVTEEIGTWGTETPAGEGDVPWEEFLDIVPDNVHLIIEREGGESRIEDIQSAKALLHRLEAC